MVAEYSPYYPDQPAYVDRYQAGRELTALLASYRRRKTLLVLAISGEGLEVALSIAQNLHAPVDLLLSGLLPIPQRPESSLGAVVEDTFVLNDGLVSSWGLTTGQVLHAVRDVQDQVKHRMQRLRGDKPLPNIRGKTVIIADDGQGIGFPIMAAVEWAIKHKPRAIVIAIPVAPKYDIKRLAPLVSEVVCPIQTSQWNLSIAGFYRRWKEPSEAEIAANLRMATE